MVDFKVFDENLYLLEEIFSKDKVAVKLERLKFIYTNTEESWFKNLERFQKSEVKYILICEAPPYSETEVPIFFYNQYKSNFHKTIWKTFFDEDIIGCTQEEIYQRFADLGFLLIDNIPFAMAYSPKHRRTEAYFKLIKDSLEWTLEKMCNSKINLSKNVKIAFGFKLNAIQFIEATNGKLDCKGNILEFDNSNIGADGSGFTSFKILKRIFLEDFRNYKYFNGERENPYCNKNENPLNFLNPKALFWHYEAFHYKNSNHQNFMLFIQNLINNKLSEYNRNENELWEMYHRNSTKQ